MTGGGLGRHAGTVLAARGQRFEVLAFFLQDPVEGGLGVLGIDEGEHFLVEEDGVSLGPHAGGQGLHVVGGLARELGHRAAVAKDLGLQQPGDIGGEGVGVFGGNGRLGAAGLEGSLELAEGVEVAAGGTAGDGEEAGALTGGGGAGDVAPGVVRGVGAAAAAGILGEQSLAVLE